MHGCVSGCVSIRLLDRSRLLDSSRWLDRIRLLDGSRWQAGCSIRRRTPWERRDDVTSERRAERLTRPITPADAATQSRIGKERSCGLR